MEHTKEGMMEKSESEMTSLELCEKGRRLAMEAAKLPIAAVYDWIEASKEVERVYELATGIVNIEWCCSRTAFSTRR